jgi:hypothetical protein
MVLCPHEPRNLYEINTRLWLRELGAATLDDVPDRELDHLAAQGFDLIWLMGVWAPSPAAETLAKTHPALRARCQVILPDLGPDDLVASPYAIVGYELSPRLGESAALDRLRRRLHQRGLGLILDFVPNHTAFDHPWLDTHPEYFIEAPPGGPLDLQPGEVPTTFVAASGRRFYHGKDPYFPPWIDTAQIDYRRRSARRAMIEELRRVAMRCDGVRCDMAMLLLSDVFHRTWAHTPLPPPFDHAQGEFWAEAIDVLRAERPDFLLLAEAYWGTDRRLTQLGFDFIYDKGLYDLMHSGDAGAVRRHVGSGRFWQRRQVRFLENHDEDRIAAALPWQRHQVAALITLSLPGLRLIHHGQLDGARVALPVQLARGPREDPAPEVRDFYGRVLGAMRDPVLRRGAWKALPPEAAWADNHSHNAFVIYSWDGSHLGVASDGSHRLLVANMAGHPAQCRVRLPLPGLLGRVVQIREILGAGPTPPGDEVAPDGRPIYRRDGGEMTDPGLFVELAGHTAQLLWLGADGRPRQHAQG